MDGAVIFSFGLGAIIGSFLNVVSLRAHTGLGIGGRSKCMVCGKTLTWCELIPIISFILQAAKCRGCNTKISWQYPIVEAITGVLFAALIYLYPPVTLIALAQLLLYLIATSILIVISVYDFKHKIIPDGFVYLFDALALLSVFLGGASWFHSPHLWTILAGPLLALPFALLWAVSKGKWIGLGDAKLVLGIGWLIGLSAGLNGIILAFWIGAAVSIIWMLASHKRFKKGIEIPFGPFLILGMYIAWIFGANMIDLRMLAALF